MKTATNPRVSLICEYLYRFVPLVLCALIAGACNARLREGGPSETNSKGNDLQYLSEVVRFEGDLSVNCQEESVQRIDLPNMIELDGSLIIEECYALEAISFPNLVTVTGDIQIRNVAPLTEGWRLDLPSLTSVGGNLLLQDVLALTQMDLRKIKHMGRGATIESTSGLTEIDWPLLKSVAGPIRIHLDHDLTHISASDLVDVDGAVDIGANDALRTIAMPALESIDGPLRVVDHLKLETVDVGAVWVAGNIELVGNEVISSILLKATKVDGSITLTNNPYLLEFHAPVTSAQTMHVSSNARLQTLDLELRSLTNDLIVSRNPALESLPTTLQSIGGYVQIEDLWAQDVSMPALTEVGLDLNIRNASRLAQIHLDQLHLVGGSMDVQQIPQLTTFVAPNLVTIGHGLILVGTGNNLHWSLSALISIGSELSVVGNDSLLSLDLTALQTIGSELSISENEAMTAIRLPQLLSVNDRFSVLNMHQLTTLQAPLLAGPMHLSIQGNIKLCQSVADEIRARATLLSPANIGFNKSGC